MKRCGAGDDRGSGSVLVVAVVLVLVLVLGSGLAIGAAVVAGQRARTAADLAAVAGASALGHGAPDPCHVASRVASGNGARVTLCRTAGQDVEVLAETDAPTLWAPARAAARAGPQD